MKNMDCETCKYTLGSILCEGCVRYVGTDGNKRYTHYEPKPMTNGDRIRAMTDEELTNEMIGCPPDRIVRCQLECKCSQCWLEWLQQPVKEDAE